MCLIVVKKRGVPFNEEELARSLACGAFRNSDGGGFAIKRNSSDKKHKILMSKGYVDTREEFLDGTAGLLKAIKAIGVEDDDELMVHLRFASMQNGRDIDILMHPFVIPPNGDETYLDMTEFVTSLPVFCHNGFFPDIAWGTTEWGSDTYLLAKNVLSDYDFLKELLSYEDKQDSHLYKWFMGTNKLAFLTAEKDMVLLGDFIEEGSYFYSNKYYKYTDGKSIRPAFTFNEETEIPEVQETGGNS